MIRITSGLDREWFEYDGAEFQVQPLTKPQLIECLSYSEQHKLGTMFELLCQYGVTDWKGVEDESGPVEFKSELLNHLPLNTFAAVANHILRTNQFGAEEEKN